MALSYIYILICCVFCKLSGLNKSSLHNQNLSQWLGMGLVCSVCKWGAFVLSCMKLNLELLHLLYIVGHRAKRKFRGRGVLYVHVLLSFGPKSFQKHFFNKRP